MVATPEGLQEIYLGVEEEKCPPPNPDALWLKNLTLDQLRVRDELINGVKKDIFDYKYMASCNCKRVQIGFNAEPLYVVCCCCNDCVAAAHYVDRLATRNGHFNHSFQVCPQSDYQCGS